MMQMIGQMIRRFWTHLLIAFSDNYTVEGFEKTNRKFELPADLAELDLARKRQLTICNLFANQNLSIFEIVKVLDSSLHQVIPALIEHGLIKERRRNRRARGATPPKGHSGTLSILPEETRANEDTREPEQHSNAAKACSSEGREVSPTLIDLSPTGRRMAS
jgi:hypothetical protein